MKKNYPSKELSMEEAPILLQLQRRHTIREGDNDEENPSMQQRPPFSRSNSTTCMYKSPDTSSGTFSNASTVVITESELSSSWLYKNRKEQMNNNNNESSTCDAEKMQANKEENTPKLHKSELKSSSMDQGRPKKSTSCFCYTMIILGILFVSLLILAGVAGILWMELFPSTETTKGTEDNLKTASGALNPMKKIGRPIDGSRSIADGDILTLSSNPDKSITLDDLSSGSIVQMFPNQVTNLEENEKDDLTSSGDSVSTNAPVRELAIPSIISGVTSFFVKNLEPPKAKTNDDGPSNPNQNIMVPIRNLFNMNGSQNLVTPIRNFFNPNRNQSIVSPIRNLFNPGPNSPYSKLFDLYNNMRNENREKLNSSVTGNISPKNDQPSRESNLENSNPAENDIDHEFEKQFEDFDKADVDWVNSFDFENEEQVKNQPEIPSLEDTLKLKNEDIEIQPIESKVDTEIENKSEKVVEFPSNDSLQKALENVDKIEYNEQKSNQQTESISNTAEISHNANDIIKTDASLSLPNNASNKLTFETLNEIHDNFVDEYDFKKDSGDFFVHESVKEIPKVDNSIKQEKSSGKDSNSESVNQSSERDESIKQSLSESQSKNDINVESNNDHILRPFSQTDSKSISTSEFVNKLTEDDHLVKHPSLDSDSQSFSANDAKSETEEGHSIRQSDEHHEADSNKSFPFEAIKENELPVQEPDYDPEKSFTFETIKDDDNEISNVEQSRLHPEFKTPQRTEADEKKILNENGGDFGEMQPFPPVLMEEINSDNSNIFENLNDDDLTDDTDHNLKNSELNEEFNWGRPIFETAVPAAINFMNRFRGRVGEFQNPESEFTDLSSKPARQFSLQTALDTVKSQDSSSDLVTPRMSTKKPPGRQESIKRKNIKERHSYLTRLRNLLFEKKM